MLANAKTWNICLTTLRRLDRWQLLAALAMPDHLHIIIAPADRDASLSGFCRWFKRWFNQMRQQDCRASVSDADANRLRGVSPKRTTSSAKQWEWQEGCFDRLLRSDESVSDKWAYIRENPVRAALTANAEAWPYQFAFNSDNAKL